MKEPSASISLRIPRELWSKINELAGSRNCPDFSHAARSLIESGIWMIEHKSDLSDPEKSQKLIEEFNSKLNEKDVFDWVGQLTDLQIQGLQIAFKLEKEKRVH